MYLLSYYNLIDPLKQSTLSFCFLKLMIKEKDIIASRYPKKQIMGF